MLNLVLPAGDIPDMTSYVRFSDTAGVSQGGTYDYGVIRGGQANGVNINDGLISGTTYSYDTYTGTNNSLLISKGTLENVVRGKELQSATDVAATVGRETTDRQSAVNDLQRQIDAVTSSSDVVDIVDTYLDLTRYSGTYTDDDVIKVLEDERHNNAHSYWRATNQGILKGETVDAEGQNIEEIKIVELDGQTTIVGTPTPTSQATISSFTGTTLTVDRYPHFTGITNTTNYPIALNTELRRISSLHYDRIYYENNKWYMEKKIEKLVLNGTENWKNRYGSGSKYCHYVALPNVNTITAGSNILSDYFVYDQNTTDNLYSQVGTMVKSYDGNGYFTYSGDLATFKTWLGTHNVTVYYDLAEPVVTEITDSTLLSQLNALVNVPSMNSRNRVLVTQTEQANKTSMTVDAKVYKWLYIGKEGPYYTKGETETVLEDYVKFTDYPTGSKTGVIKVNQYNLTVDSNGCLNTPVQTYNNFTTMNDKSFIGKGTLNNVLNAVIGDVNAVLDEINGEVI